MGESASMVSIFWDTIKNFKTMVFRWCRWFSTNILWNSSKWKLSLSRTPAEFLSFDQKEEQKNRANHKSSYQNKIFEIQNTKKVQISMSKPPSIFDFWKGLQQQKKKTESKFSVSTQAEQDITEHSCTSSCYVCMFLRYTSIHIFFYGRSSHIHFLDTLLRQECLHNLLLQQQPRVLFLFPVLNLDLLKTQNISSSTWVVHPLSFNGPAFEPTIGNCCKIWKKFEVGNC